MVIADTTIMAGIAGTLKNKQNKIREKIERDNKEVNAHHSVDLAALLLQVKNRVASWYERAKRTTNIVSVDMKMVLFNSLGNDTREQIEIWTTTHQTTLKLCCQLEAKPTPFIDMPGTTKNKLNNVQEEFELL